eukprot:COSAG01_NODE_4849_length_4684_cov_12.227263_1_plen_79_part_00
MLRAELSTATAAAKLGAVTSHPRRVVVVRRRGAHTRTPAPTPAHRARAAAAMMRPPRRGRSVPENLLGSALHASEKSQ